MIIEILVFKLKMLDLFLKLLTFLLKYLYFNSNYELPQVVRAFFTNMFVNPSSCWTIVNPHFSIQLLRRIYFRNLYIKHGLFLLCLD